MATKNQSYDALIDFLEPYFMKLPPLSKNAREKLAGIAPILSLIFGILGILAGVGGLGLLSVLSPFMALAGGLHAPFYGIIAVLLGLLSSILLLASYSGLKNRRFSGWKLLFWSEIISFVASLVNPSIFSILIALLALYLLYEIKPLYR